jgi:hypothetical protein
VWLRFGEGEWIELVALPAAEQQKLASETEKLGSPLHICRMADACDRAVRRAVERKQAGVEEAEGDWGDDSAAPDREPYTQSRCQKKLATALERARSQGLNPPMACLAAR